MANAHVYVRVCKFTIGISVCYFGWQLHPNHFCPTFRPTCRRPRRRIRVEGLSAFRAREIGERFAHLYRYLSRLEGKINDTGVKRGATCCFGSVGRADRPTDGL